MFSRADKMNFLSGQDEFRRGQDDFFQTANQPISVRHLSQPYNNGKYTMLQIWLNLIMSNNFQKLMLHDRTKIPADN